MRSVKDGKTGIPVENKRHADAHNIKIEHHVNKARIKKYQKPENILDELIDETPLEDDFDYSFDVDTTPDATAFDDWESTQSWSKF